MLVGIDCVSSLIVYEADVFAQGGAWLLELWANLDFGEEQDFGKRASCCDSSEAFCGDVSELPL